MTRPAAMMEPVASLGKRLNSEIESRRRSVRGCAVTRRLNCGMLTVVAMLLVRIANLLVRLSQNKYAAKLLAETPARALASE